METRMPLVAHNGLPTFERLREEGQIVNLEDLFAERGFPPGCVPDNRCSVHLAFSTEAWSSEPSLK